MWRKTGYEQGPEAAGLASSSAVAWGDGSIAINGSFTGIANTGDNATFIHIPQEELRPPSRVDAPEDLVYLPFRPSRDATFVGRTQELARLDAALDGTGTAVVQALHGLGGIGKSTLAAYWAAARSGTNNPVWWITADNPANLDSGLAALARGLQPALGQLPAEQLTERAVQWLATHTDWLLILDNVDNPDHLAPLLARATTGRILITSRRFSGWHHTAVPIPIDVLTPGESIDLLTRIVTHSGTRSAELDGAAELCLELGHLPLALEQAGAYIAEAGIGIREYLDLLADHPADMYRLAKDEGDSERTIARVWRITLDRLAETPLAGKVLRILAWWAPDGIPRTLLAPLGTSVAVLEAVRRLAAYSMITTTSDSLAVHRLVQSLTRTPDADDPHRQAGDVTTALHDATTLLRSALPGPNSEEDPETWPTWRTLLPHIDALIQHASLDSDTPATTNILNGAGAFLLSHGEIRRATAYFERSLVDRIRMLGEDHSGTLTARNNLAHAYRSAGDLGRAVPLYEQTLVDRVRVMGENHTDTLNSQESLAQAYMEAGDLGRAVPLYEQAVARMVQALHEDHPRVISSRLNLASVYRSLGDLRRAIPLHEQNLADMLRVLGEDHPKTLYSRDNLAGAYQLAGDLGRAIALFEQNLADRVRVLGEDHPNTLHSRYNLAGAYGEAGDLGRAISLQEQNLADMVRVMGEDHPATLSARDDLVGSYKSAGDLGRAIPLQEQNLADMVRVMGEDHPSTLIARDNLAGSYKSAGDLGRAIPLQEQSLADMERVLGKDHPSTLDSRDSLAVAYEAVGDLGRAVALFEQNMVDRVRVLGRDHPDTLIARNSLAYAYLAGDDLGRATRLLEQNLADMKRVLSKGHPGTLAARHNLANAYLAGDDLERAIPLFEQTIADMRQVLSTDHPDIFTALNNLAYAYELAGDPVRAVALFEQNLVDRVRVLGEDHPDTLVSRENLEAAYEATGKTGATFRRSV